MARLVGYEQAQMMTWRYPFAGRASDSLLRYQTTTNRRLTDAIEQLELLQQKRKAEAPLPEQHDPKPHGTDAESQEPPDESAPASEDQTGEHLKEPRCDPQPPESCGTKPPVAAAEVALRMNPRPRMGERVSYYIGAKAKGQTSDWQRAQPLARHDPAKAPYDPDYYLVKIDDWLERYGRFLGIKPETAQQEMTL